MSFESGSTAGNVDCVDIGIIDDDCKERNESFVFALCAGGDPSVHIDDFYSDVYIIDNDGKLSKSTYIIIQHHSVKRRLLLMIRMFVTVSLFKSSCTGFSVSWEWWCS